MSNSPRTVLVCDDDESILDVTSILLSYAGFNVLIQQESNRLIRQAIKEQPDVLLLDIWMPLMSGDQLTRIIKKTSEIAHIPVILFSAAIDGKIIAKEAGADRFIEKPFDLDNLSHIINDVL